MLGSSLGQTSLTIYSPCTLGRMPLKPVRQPAWSIHREGRPDPRSTLRSVLWMAKKEPWTRRFATDDRWRLQI